jgi:hypothetical protein
VAPEGHRLAPLKGAKCLPEAKGAQKNSDNMAPMWRGLPLMWRGLPLMDNGCMCFF